MLYLVCGVGDSIYGISRNSIFCGAVCLCSCVWIGIDLWSRLFFLLCSIGMDLWSGYFFCCCMVCLMWVVEEKRKFACGGSDYAFIQHVWCMNKSIA